MEINTIILQDKFIELGESPIYDSEYNNIGTVSYKLSLANKFKILKDQDCVFEGTSKVLALMPQMSIANRDGIEVGVIKRKFTFFTKKYLYTREDGATYEIVGNIMDRKFKVLRTDGTPVINIYTLSSIISLRPHTFAVEFLESDIDVWEGITVIQGVRMMVKDENSTSGGAPA